jgi:ribosomal protein L16 Arg81 hydroxylase
MEKLSLEWLIAPTRSDEFFREHWERKPLLVQRGRRDYFSELLTLEQMDRDITSLNFVAPEITVADARRTIRREDYTYSTGLIDVGRLYQHFRDGSTIIMEQQHLRVAALGALCRSMEHQLSTRFQTNVYLTPPNAQGFKVHYDTHDVFVIQVAGSKDWTLYDSPVELPYRNQSYRSDEHKVGPASRTFHLEAGDLVYIPRGLLHEAVSTDEHSVHITLGLLFTSWTDLLAEALARVGLTDVEFRHSLPAGFANDSFDRSDARATFRRLLDRLTAQANVDEALDHFAQDLVATRHPILPGQLQQIEGLPSLTVDDRVEARPHVIMQVEQRDDGTVIHCYGGTVKFPPQAREALVAALAQPSFVVRELPGPLDDAGKLVLVRRLIVEGLLARVRNT